MHISVTKRASSDCFGVARLVFSMHYRCNFIPFLSANYPSLFHGLANFQDRRQWQHPYVHALIDGSNWPIRVRKIFLLCLFIFHSLGPLQIVWFLNTPDFITEGKRIDLECFFSGGWPSLWRSTGSRMTK